MKYAITILITVLASLSGITQDPNNQSNNYEIKKESNKYSLYDLSGKAILNTKYDSIVSIDLNNVGLTKDGKWGLYSIDQKQLIEPIYDHIIGQSVFIPDELPTIKNKNNTFSLKPYSLENKDFLLVIKDSKCGIIRQDGTFLVPQQYDLITVKNFQIDSESSYYFELYDNKKVGMYTKDGQSIFEPQFSEIYVVNNTILTKDSTKIELHNMEGTKIELPYIIEDYEPNNNEGAIVLVSNGKKGVFKDGKLIADIKYDDIGSFFGKKGIKTINGNLIGIISPDGSLVVEPDYDDIEITEIGFIVTRDGKEGFLQFNNRIFLPLEFDDIYFIPQPFIHPPNAEKGLITIQDGKVGFTLPFKKLGVDPIYDDVEYVGTGFVVTKDSLQGYMQNDKTMLLPVEYENIRVWKEGHTIIVRKNQKEGLLDVNGNEVLPIKYNSLALYPSGYILAQLDNKYGLYTFRGEELVKPNWTEYEIKSFDVVSFSNGDGWHDFNISELMEGKK